MKLWLLCYRCHYIIYAEHKFLMALCPNCMREWMRLPPHVSLDYWRTPARTKETELLQVSHDAQPCYCKS